MILRFLFCILVISLFMLIPISIIVLILCLVFKPNVTRIINKTTSGQTMVLKVYKTFAFNHHLIFITQKFDDTFEL